jgi:hypothetical protein
MSISNTQRMVGVIDGVGDGVAPTDDVGVGVGDNVGVLVIVGLGVRVIVGVGVLVAPFVGVTVRVAVIDGVGVIVAGGVGDTKALQSIIVDLDNVLLVQGESNLTVIFLLPLVVYVLNALWQLIPEQTPSTPIGDVVPSPQSTVNIISPTAAMLFRLVVLITVTLLQSTS